ncbi:MAG: glucosamine-6-phosphate deaminase, partial [Paludibacteraceae bacterium]|nr:glucosamine-6-phosphate deaminase [Paludibacteraceae bacterium]
QLLGIGRGGNIGFNEPGTQINSLTRLVILDNVSRNDAVDMFGSIDNVPISAITMGIGTILSAREIMLVAWGEHKSEMIKQAIEEEQSLSCPASTLQSHANATMILDLASASRLTRLSEPWLLTSCEWTDQLTRRAIVRLCQQTGKPVLKLTTKDYVEHGLSELITKYESAYNCNIKIFNDLQHTITGWPGGKPDADDSHRPERAQPYPKRILIFSPHPDDDVISMGATFHRLIEQDHECHVAYETSGNIAVDDDEIIRFMDFVKGYTQLQQQDHTEAITKDYNRIIRYLTQEKNDNVDTREVLDLKALLRRGEATAACRHMGLPKERIHFLNLPFYETGRVKKGDLTDKDVHIVKQLLQKLQPHQIYAAGDLADPHGTHKVCLDAVLAAIDELKDEPWLKECRIWMYRGAWMEWDIDQIEMAVPISPEQLRFKRNTILKHQSQMESAPFLGNDERLFWQRAEDRNRATAELYARLGLASYEAIEAFVQYHPI